MTTSDSVRPLTAAVLTEGEESDVRASHVIDRNGVCRYEGHDVRMCHGCRLLATLDEARAGSLDAARQETEAALPEGWRLDGLMRSGDGWQARAEPARQIFLDILRAFSPEAQP